MQRLDPYYFDWNHLNGEGSDIYSRAFAEFFNLYAAGERVDHLFYSSIDEYLAGKCDSLPELDEPRLKKPMNGFIRFGGIVTPNSAVVS